MALVNYINVLLKLNVKKLGILKNIFICVRVSLFKKAAPNN